MKEGWFGIYNAAHSQYLKEGKKDGRENLIQIWRALRSSAGVDAIKAS